MSCGICLYLFLFLFLFLFVFIFIYFYFYFLQGKGLLFKHYNYDNYDLSAVFVIE